MPDLPEWNVLDTNYCRQPADLKTKNGKVVEKMYDTGLWCPIKGEGLVPCEIPYNCGMLYIIYFSKSYGVRQNFIWY